MSTHTSQPRHPSTPTLARVTSQCKHQTDARSRSQTAATWIQRPNGRDQRPAETVGCIAGLGSASSKGQPLLICATIVHACRPKAPAARSKIQAYGITHEVAPTPRELLEPMQLVDGHPRRARGGPEHFPLQDRHRDVANLPIYIPAAHARLGPENEILVHTTLGIEFHYTGNASADDDLSRVSECSARLALPLKEPE